MALACLIWLPGLATRALQGSTTVVPNIADTAKFRDAKPLTLMVEVQEVCHNHMERYSSKYRVTCT